MDNKVLVFIFILFIIYLACKKNIIKGGKIITGGILPGAFHGLYELASGPMTSKDFVEITKGKHWAETDNQGNGYIWTNAEGQNGLLIEI